MIPLNLGKNKIPSPTPLELASFRNYPDSYNVYELRTILEQWMEWLKGMEEREAIRLQYEAYLGGWGEQPEGYPTTADLIAWKHVKLKRIADGELEVRGGHEWG